jgi:DNA-directed RNA polymerase subunit beta
MKTNEEILRTFYQVERITLRERELHWNVSQGLVNRKLSHEIKHPRSEEVLVGSHRRITDALYKELVKARVAQVRVSASDLDGAYTVADLVNRQTGEVLIEANKPVTPELWATLAEAGISEVDVFFPEQDDIGGMLSKTLDKDAIRSQKEALIEIYRKLRPGDPPTLETATALFQGMFFDPRKYDFSKVGRLKFNIKLGLDTPLDKRTLDPADFVGAIQYLFKLRKNIGNVDDIDHLGNRRVRAVGELLENQFRIGLVRMERAIKEKMSVYQEMSTAMPHDLVNAKPVMAAIREFFGSSQLSQFMDQTNPLSEITHKRRLSALGPGGLSRERAGFEVRDVHPTHYGRICPIETPEGPNIGLISSLSCFARINEYGFIESPYRKVKNGRIVDYVQVLNAGDSEFKAGDIVEKEKIEEINEELKRRKAATEAHCFYLSAWEEDRYVIAQANVQVDEKGRIATELVNARLAGNFVLKSREEVDYVDVSPKQLVSVAASLIPFLENDDANRALMGSNMQRQSVPLIRGEAPLVGTGMERVTARDSGAVVICRRDGIVDQVDSERIIVRVESDHSGVLSREVGADIYTLIKFKRSNQNTCINQKPLVRVGDRVRQGQVLADGPCTDRGELALGRNVLCAFLPWRGYNFEDAILVSEKLVKDDYYTSIHIEEFEIEARDTKLGPEEITRDIPNISESFLRNLDESGVIRIGATVKPGDILVGKVTPKGETQLTPEEKLLRAIFGEKAGDVRDASLYCPPGIEGTVVDVKIFCRKGAEKDERHRAIEAAQKFKLDKNLADEIRILTDERLKRLTDLLGGKKLLADLHDEKTNKRLLTKGTELERGVIERISTRNLKRLRLEDKDPLLIEKIDEIEEMTSRQIEVLEKINKERKEKLEKGDELPPGVIKMVKSYIAMKRKLSVGDKMAGRHGNKGVIARIVPEEDMPYLPDGTPVEIVLNPLGVPSRMNVGQILETHLGWACKELGQQVSRLFEKETRAEAVRRWFKEVFGQTAVWKKLAELEDDELLAVADGFRQGIPVATPVFDGAREAEIRHLLDVAGLPNSGKVELRDGMTGDAFTQKVTVGFIYMLKLSHLVDDKIHARSIGPYSLITQQPLGGKAQFGGQRFGEMEVWALEAYGAAHILQELLTAKSDDVYGRAKIYEAIVKGEAGIEPGVPESFNVLVRELQSLCLDVELMKRQRPQAAETAADD